MRATGVGLMGPYAPFPRPAGLATGPITTGLERHTPSLHQETKIRAAMDTSIATQKGHVTIGGRCMRLPMGITESVQDSIFKKINKSVQDITAYAERPKNTTVMGAQVTSYTQGRRQVLLG